MKVKSLGANQTQIETSKWTILVSYETPVAAYDKENWRYIKTAKFHSKTTSKHIQKWLETFMGEFVVVEAVEQKFLDSLIA